MKRFLLAAAFCLGAANANATILQVSNPGALTQGPYTLETFEAGLGAGVTYSSTSGVRTVTASGWANGGTPSGSRGLTTNAFPDPIFLDFTNPVSSVGLWFGNDDLCCSTGFTAFMDIFGTSGLIGSISVVANMNDFADQFLGFVSDELVTRVSVRFGNGSDVGLYTYIDDVYFNVAQQSVPEPLTVSLLGLGLLGLARRRSRT